MIEQWNRERENQEHANRVNNEGDKDKYYNDGNGSVGSEKEYHGYQE